MKFFRPCILSVFFFLFHFGDLTAQESGLRMRVAVPVSSRHELSIVSGEMPVDLVRNDTAWFETTVTDARSIAARIPGAVLYPSSVQFSESDMASTLEEARTYRKYPTLEQYIQMMNDFATAYPELCMLDTIGFSIMGKPVLVLKISANVRQDEDEPGFMYSGSIHGDEILGYVLLLHLADTLLASYGKSTYLTALLDQTEIWINPLANPDGAYYLSDTTLVYSRRYNINGVDLNRNFPDPVSGDSLNDYVGRQQETVDMMNFMMEHRFSMSTNLHGGDEVVNYPWDHKYALHPDDDWFIFISREYADEVHAENESYMSGFPDGITNGADWYIIYGGRQDYMTYYLGGREVTIELSYTKLFPSSQLQLYWDYNDLSLINLAQQARYGIYGTVTNSNREGIASKITILDHDDNSSSVSSETGSGKFFRYLKEGYYDILVQSEGYEDDTLFSIPVIDYARTWLSINYNNSGDLESFYKIDYLLSDIRSDNPSTDSFLTYPNPADDLLIVQLGVNEDINLGMTIYSLNGSVVKTIEVHFEGGISLVDLSGIKDGFYFFRISNGEKIYSGKFIKSTL